MPRTALADSVQRIAQDVGATRREFLGAAGAAALAAAAGHDRRAPRSPALSAW